MIWGGRREKAPHCWGAIIFSMPARSASETVVLCSAAHFFHRSRVPVDTLSLMVVGRSAWGFGPRFLGSVVILNLGNMEIVANTVQARP